LKIFYDIWQFLGNIFKLNDFFQIFSHFMFEKDFRNIS
jgi:hypothetical protein